MSSSRGIRSKRNRPRKRGKRKRTRELEAATGGNRVSPSAARAGADLIIGGAGNDRIDAGGGMDGELGDDVIFSGICPDQLFGDIGIGQLWDERGDDFIMGAWPSP